MRKIRDFFEQLGSMRVRLILAFFLVVAVAILSLVFYVHLDSVRQVRAFLFESNSEDVEALAVSLESYYRQNGNWDGVESVLASNMPEHGQGEGRGRRVGGGGGPRFTLTDAEGNVIADNTGLFGPEGKVDPEIFKQGNQLTAEDGTLVGVLLISGGPQFRSGDEQALLNNLDRAAWRAGLVALALALILALWFSARLVKPILELTNAAQAVRNGNLNQKVIVKGKDEVAILADTFNKMAESLAQSEERRKQMTADIAHELRTPLAVQRAHLEAMQDGIYPLTIENVQPVLDQTALLSRLVDDLRVLALADAGELPLNIRPVDLPKLIKNNLAKWESVAIQKKISLHFEFENSEQGFVVDADAERLGQVLNNLIGNALRHTPHGGCVWVRLSPKSNHLVQLEVADNGEGLPENILPNVFERFYRGDSGRSREEGGSGLGLAIARQIVEAHGGKISASNAPQGGALFTIILPLKSL